MISKDIFKPDNESIKEVFFNANAFYNMPIYQRPYEWDKERVEQLWYDILESYNNNKQDSSIGKNYFLGSVVVVDRGDYQDVVDGQQRLITLTILFCVLREFNLDKRMKKMVDNTIKDNVSDKIRLKLTNHSNNDALFRSSIIDNFNLTKTKGEIKNNKFMLSAYYLNILIKNALDVDSDISISDINDFITYLFENITIIKVVCYDESFAIKLFSVLNDRGLNLTPADIIKAHMMESMVGDDVRLNNFITVWDDVKRTVNSINDTMKGVLSLYFYYLNSGNPKKPLQDEFKPKIRDSNPQDLILDIRNFSSSYYDIFSNDSDKYISALKHLNHNIYWKSILITAKHIGYDSFDDLKILITKYYYSSWISGGTAARIKQTSFNILKMVKQNVPIENYWVNKDGKSVECKGIKSVVLDNLRRYKDYRNILGHKSIDNESWVRPVLLLVEYFSNENMKYISSVNGLYVEHILPKGWDNDDLNWSSNFSKDKAEEYLHCLGNLTLLSGKRNIDSSDVNFKDKNDIYLKNYGKGIDGKFSFKMTGDILNDYDDWTIDDVELRTSCLIDDINNILSI